MNIEYLPFMTFPKLEIQVLFDPQSTQAKQAFSIYEEAFPDEEREPIEALAKRMASRKRSSVAEDSSSHFWAIMQNEKVIGFAVFGFDSKTRMTFVDYLAIHEKLRGNGFGSALFQAIINQTKKDCARLGTDPAKGICFEVEKPEEASTPSDRTIRKRRIEFYKRNGAFVIENLNFIAPPIKEGYGPVPYYLMYSPINTDGPPFSRALLTEIVKAVLLFGYDLPPNNSYYKNAIESVMSYQGID